MQKHPNQIEADRQRALAPDLDPHMPEPHRSEMLKQLVERRDLIDKQLQDLPLNAEGRASLEHEMLVRKEYCSIRIELLKQPPVPSIPEETSEPPEVTGL